MITTFSIRPKYRTGQSVMFDALNAELRLITTLKVVELPAGNLGMIYFLPVFLKYFSAVLRSELVIITGSRSIYGFLREAPFYLVCLLLKKKVVFYNHGVDLVSLLNYRSALWLFRMLKISFILPTNYLLPSILQKNGFNFFILRNPCLVAKVNTDKLEVNDNFIYVGNFIRGKGQIRLLELLESNRAVTSSVNLKFYGSIENIDLKTRQLKSFKNFYGGQLNASEINILYNSAKTLVFLSDYSVEYNPLVVIDALFMGLKLILLDTPVLRAAVADYPKVFWMKEITLEEWNKAINWANRNEEVVSDTFDCRKYSKEEFAEGVRCITNKLLEVT